MRDGLFVIEIIFKLEKKIQDSKNDIVKFWTSFFDDLMKITHLESMVCWESLSINLIYSFLLGEGRPHFDQE